MIGRYNSWVVETVARTIIPFNLMFGVYVVTHGHYSPGGGFQGGVIMAASTILLRLTIDRRWAERRFPPALGTILAGVGLLVFVLMGFLPMLAGGQFLNYEHLPITWVHGAELRALGILLVEVGITMAVWGTLVTIFDHLARDGR